MVVFVFLEGVVQKERFDQVLFEQQLEQSQRKKAVTWG